MRSFTSTISFGGIALISLLLIKNNIVVATTTTTTTTTIRRFTRRTLQNNNNYTIVNNSTTISSSNVNITATLSTTTLSTATTNTSQQQQHGQQQQQPIPNTSSTSNTSATTTRQQQQQEEDQYRTYLEQECESQLILSDYDNDGQLSFMEFTSFLNTTYLMIPIIKEKFTYELSKKLFTTLASCTPKTLFLLRYFIPNESSSTASIERCSEFSKDFISSSTSRSSTNDVLHDSTMNKTNKYIDLDVKSVFDMSNNGNNNSNGDDDTLTLTDVLEVAYKLKDESSRSLPNSLIINMTYIDEKLQDISAIQISYEQSRKIQQNITTTTIPESPETTTSSFYITNLCNGIDKYFHSNGTIIFNSSFPSSPTSPSLSQSPKSLITSSPSSIVLPSFPHSPVPPSVPSFPHPPLQVPPSVPSPTSPSVLVPSLLSVPSPTIQSIPVLFTIPTSTPSFVRRIDSPTYPSITIGTTVPSSMIGLKSIQPTESISPSTIFLSRNDTVPIKTPPPTTAEKITISNNKNQLLSIVFISIGASSFVIFIIIFIRCIRKTQQQNKDKEIINTIGFMHGISNGNNNHDQCSVTQSISENNNNFDHIPIVSVSISSNDIINNGVRNNNRLNNSDYNELISLDNESRIGSEDYKDHYIENVAYTKHDTTSYPDENDNNNNHIQYQHAEIEDNTKNQLEKSPLNTSNEDSNESSLSDSSLSSIYVKDENDNNRNLSSRQFHVVDTIQHEFVLSFPSVDSKDSPFVRQALDPDPRELSSQSTTSDKTNTTGQKEYTILFDNYVTATNNASPTNDRSMFPPENNIIDMIDTNDSNTFPWVRNHQQYPEYNDTDINQTNQQRSLSSGEDYTTIQLLPNDSYGTHTTGSRMHIVDDYNTQLVPVSSGEGTISKNSMELNNDIGEKEFANATINTVENNISDTTITDDHSKVVNDDAAVEVDKVDDNVDGVVKNPVSNVSEQIGNTLSNDNGWSLNSLLTGVDSILRRPSLTLVKRRLSERSEYRGVVIVTSNTLNGSNHSTCSSIVQSARIIPLHARSSSKASKTRTSKLKKDKKLINDYNMKSTSAGNVSSTQDTTVTYQSLLYGNYTTTTDVNNKTDEKVLDEVFTINQTAKVQTTDTITKSKDSTIPNLYSVKDENSCASSSSSSTATFHNDDEEEEGYGDNYNDNNTCSVNSIDGGLDKDVSSTTTYRTASTSSNSISVDTNYISTNERNERYVYTNI